MTTLWNLLSSSNVFVGFSSTRPIGICSWGMIPPRSCPSQWRTWLSWNHLSLSSWGIKFRGGFQLGQHTIIMPHSWLLQLTIMFFLCASHHASLGASYLTSSQKNPISWKKKLKLRQCKWFPEFIRKWQSVDANPGPWHWSPASFPLPFPPPFYFVVENSGIWRKVRSLGGKLMGELCNL